MSLVMLKSGFGKVAGDFPESIITKGKLLYENHHVFDVEEFPGMITGKVSKQSILNSSAYKVAINLKDDRRIDKATCECAAAESGRCEHVAALMYFINNKGGEAKTCGPQTRSRSSMKDEHKERKLVAEMFPNKKKKITQYDAGPPSGLSLPDCPLMPNLKHEPITEGEITVSSPARPATIQRPVRNYLETAGIVPNRQATSRRSVPTDWDIQRLLEIEEANYRQAIETHRLTVETQQLGVESRRLAVESHQLLVESCQREAESDRLEAEAQRQDEASYQLALENHGLLVESHRLAAERNQQETENWRVVISLLQSIYASLQNIETCVSRLSANQ